MSRKHNVGFFHIPKNGGTSVRRLLAPVDDFRERFTDHADHAQLGRLQMGHIPLVWLREYFRDAFDAFCAVETFAVWRDPQVRFASALSQRIRSFRGGHLGDLGAGELRSEVQLAISHLESRRGFPGHEFFYFVRQADCISIDGALGVRHLYRLENLDTLMRLLSERIGLPMPVRERENDSLDFGSPTRSRFLNKAGSTVRAMAPAWLHKWLKQQTIRLLGIRRNDRIERMVAEDDEIRAFIRDYYEDDYRLDSATVRC